jgi:hypothetical protein
MANLTRKVQDLFMGCGTISVIPETASRSPVSTVRRTAIPVPCSGLSPKVMFLLRSASTHRVPVECYVFLCWQRPDLHPSFSLLLLRAPLLHDGGRRDVLGVIIRFEGELESAHDYPTRCGTSITPAIVFPVSILEQLRNCPKQIRVRRIGSSFCCLDFAARSPYASRNRLGTPVPFSLRTTLHVRSGSACMLAGKSFLRANIMIIPPIFNAPDTGPPTDSHSNVILEMSQ